MKRSNKMVWFVAVVLVVFLSVAITSSCADSEVGGEETVGAYLGRFKIPSVGVDVGCYSSSSQATVDAQDSAAYFYWGGHTVIADHDYQGFSAIKLCREGMTAMMVSDRGTVSYTCVDVIRGYRSDSELMDTDRKSIAGLYPEALICYTCNIIPGSISIAFFMPDY